MPACSGAGVSKPVDGLPPKQRWERSKYNAYQRDLMRKRRAEGLA